MAPIPNIRHEKFARAYIRKPIAAQAYLKAGYEPKTRNGLDAAASKLTRHDKVQSRIKELRRQMAARNRITVDSLIEQLDLDRDHARRLDQPATAISATMAAARLTGLLIEKRESGAPGEFAGQRTEMSVLDMVKAELGEGAAAALQAALAMADDAAKLEAEPEVAAPAAPIPTPTHGTGGAIN